jgi:hypothetical protein
MLCNTMSYILGPSLVAHTARKHKLAIHVSEVLQMYYIMPYVSFNVDDSYSSLLLLGDL